jgi:hypothetical protein
VVSGVEGEVAWEAGVLREWVRSATAKRNHR